MRFLIPFVVMIATALPVWADARTTVLMDALKLPELVAILHGEGLDYAADLNDDMLDGKGGAGWQVQVAAIYDPDRLAENLRVALDDALDDEQTEAGIAFFASELGQRVLDLENQARIRMGQQDVEDAARARAAELEGSGDARLAMINEMIETSDLVDRNVTSAMNSNFHFLRGLSESGEMSMTEEEMLANVLSERDDIIEDTISWTTGFLLLAYSPLSDDELRRYIDFTAIPEGLAMNRGFFDGFDAAYNEISYALGRAIALNMTSKEL